ncbi:MAG: DUF4173 domain-containing protein [Acidimicrobiales bacterium]
MSNITEPAPEGVVVPPHPRRSREDVAPPDRSVGIAVALCALGFAVWSSHRFTSVAGALFFVTCSIGLLVSGRLRTRQSRFFVGLAPVFGMWLLVRQSPWLIPLDMIAASGFLGLGVATSTRGLGLHYGIRDYVAMPGHVGGQAIDSVGFASRTWSSREAASRRTNGRAVVLGLTVAAPLVALLGLLLATGDQAFADLMATVFGGSLGAHVVRVVLGMILGLVLVRVASGDDARPRPPMPARFGPVESLTVLGALISLYVVFAAAQVIGSLFPSDAVSRSASETREWVHHGFFPLLWASVITLVALLVLGNVGRRATRRDERRFARATAVLAALTLVVVGVALYRIAEYSDVFGLTMLRLYSFLFACWIGAVFILLAARALGFGRGRRWFVAWCAGLGLMILLALNVVNPEALVVGQGASRLGRFDDRYLLSELSDDAVPAIVDVLDRLPGDKAERVVRGLCARDSRHESEGGLDWNRSRAAARSALRELCGP